jgi:Glycosyltransferase family 9 (heptosyltransferase)
LASEPPVLVLRALGLGDLLTGIPALRGLRRLHPHRSLLLAAPRVLGSWFADLGLVDDVVVTDDLSGPPPGAGIGVHDAIDLHGNGYPSRGLLEAARPRSVLSFAPPADSPDPGAHQPAWRRDEHEVLRWCRLVRSVGAECGLDDLRVPELPAARCGPGGPVVVHPGAASRSRRWPPERFAQVARALKAAGHEVVVTGGQAERGLAARVVQLAGLPEGASRAGALDLPALADLVADASLLVCGDTGVAHLATAVGTPSVLLFGPIAPSQWGPAVDVDRHVVLWHGDGTGDPHGDEPDQALLRIDVEEVLSAVQSMTTVVTQATDAHTVRNHSTV